MHKYRWGIVALLAAALVVPARYESDFQRVKAGSYYISCAASQRFVADAMPRIFAAPLRYLWRHAVAELNALSYVPGTRGFLKHSRLYALVGFH